MQASLFLCQFIATSEHLVKDFKVLELGAGVGIPGLLAAHIGAEHVTLTDYDKQVGHLVGLQLFQDAWSQRLIPIMHG